jgi:hypothetical protein
MLMLQKKRGDSHKGDQRKTEGLHIANVELELTNAKTWFRGPSWIVRIWIASTDGRRSPNATKSRLDEPSSRRAGSGN